MAQKNVETAPPPLLAHGSDQLSSVVVDAYNAEMRSADGFVGDRASKRAFQSILDDWRERVSKSGEDPLGDAPSEQLSKKQLDKLLIEGDAEAAGVVQAAIDEFSQELAAVIRRFLRLKDWKGTERIVIGGGMRQSRVGELAIGRAAVILKAAGSDVTLHPISNEPDHAGLIGCAHLVPPWMLAGHDSILAVDIGGSNIRSGIVELHNKKKPDLSGNDFLPIVLKLDELMAHLRSVRELGTRLSSLRGSAPAESGTTASTGGTVNIKSPLAATKQAADELAHTLSSLAERLAADHKKKFKLSLTGLSEIPRSYVPTLKDVLIQMLRNSAVHGIETADARQTQNKDVMGAVRIEFRKSGEGFELMFEDDGAGLLPDQLKAAAVRKQIVTKEEADAMDTRAAMALIFRPGFSTQEHVSMDAGRGVGMDVVAKSVYAIGGKIGVTTNPGKFTRFKVSLPATEEANTAVA